MGVATLNDGILFIKFVISEYAYSILATVDACAASSKSELNLFKVISRRSVSLS